MSRPPLTPVPCARRTEPSAWLCPPPGARRMPDGVDLHVTNLAKRLRQANAGTTGEPMVVQLFPSQALPWSRSCT